MFKKTIIKTSTKTIATELVDGVKKNSENPNTFEIPSWGMRQFAQPGMLVKVYAHTSTMTMGERFWVSITDRINDVDGQTYYAGIIDNDLLHIDAKCGDVIKYFSPKNIIDIFTKSFIDQAEMGLIDTKKINPDELRKFVAGMEQDSSI